MQMFKIVKRIINWTGHYKKRMYIGFIYSFFATLFASMPIIYGVFIFDHILNDYYGEATFPKEYLYLSIILMIVFVLGRFIFSYLRATSQDSIVCEKSAEVRAELGYILKRVPLGFFKDRNIGELVSAVTTDLSFIEMFTMKMVDMVVGGYINVIVTCLFMLILSPTIAIVIILGAIISLLFLFLLERVSHKNAHAHQYAKDLTIEKSIEYLRGIAVVKSFGREGIATAGVKKAFKEIKDINIKIERKFVVFNCLHLLSLKIASVLAILIASYITINGGMELPIFLVVVIFSFSMYGQVETVSNAAHVLEIIDEIMTKFDSLTKMNFIDDKCESIILSQNDIEFKNVDFAYEETEVLKNISFRIPQCTTTAIVGPSGSGKTTICNLIARFYDVKSGSITIGGNDVREFSCDNLLSNISIVFQKVYLFNDTILNNIKFGKPEATREDVIEIAKKARCHDFISALSDGYDTVIAEGGSTLSGGEKQRISIARAMLKDAPIIMLDEATASVDPENEHLIQAAISELTKGKTIITIAHRLATIENADQILVLNNGQIAQVGTHNELVDVDGIYKNFIDIRKQAENWSF